MRPLIAFGLALLGATVQAGIAYDQPHDGSGTILQSSWLDPEGYDGDWYTYDSFILTADTDITEVRWRGGYMYGGMYGKLFRFKIYFYDSIVGGSEPHCGNPSLEETIYHARYLVDSTANEVYVGTFGGTAMYDYSYTLPQPLHLPGGVKFWIRVLASQPSVPDWGYARGTGPDSSHFFFSTGMAQFHFGSGDACFTLIGSQNETVFPNQLTLSLGRNTSGSVASLVAADGVDYVACKFMVPNVNSPFVQMILDGTSALPTLTAYTFGVKAHMVDAGAFQIAAEAYNFVGAAYDTTTTSTLSLAYSVTAVTPTAPADHLGGGGAIRTRIRVSQVGPSAVTLPCSGFDQAYWSLAN